MKTMIRIALGLPCALLLAGCATSAGSPRAVHATAGFHAPAPASAGAEAEPAATRLRIWRANLHLRVRDVDAAARDAAALAEKQGGFVEEQSDRGESSARLTLRLPAAALPGSLAALEALGTVTHRQVSAEDVTEQVVDVEARLNNRRVLRDRLRRLLDQAAGVTEVLAIETELNRVQADLDAMEARLKSLRGQVELAAVSLHLERRPVPGPLGLVLKGLWWGVTRLFVLRD